MWRMCKICKMCKTHFPSPNIFLLFLLRSLSHQNVAKFKVQCPHSISRIWLSQEFGLLYTLKPLSIPGLYANQLYPRYDMLSISSSLKMFKVCPYHHKVCSKFQGKLAVTESDEDYKRCDILHVFQIHWVPNLEQGWEKSFTKSHILGVGFASQMFTRLVVKNNGVIYECLCLIEEGEWVDYETREAPTHQIPWFFISEPTGYTGKFNQTLA